MGAPPVNGAGQSRRDAGGVIDASRWKVARYAGSVGLVAAAYYVAGRIGLELAYLDGAVAALWPPAGVGLAALFLYGVRLWPGVVIGDLLLADFSTPWATVCGQTVGNTVALVVAALLLRRLTGGRSDLARVADVVALVACAVLAALVSAAFGPTALRLGDVIAADELGRVFRTWTLGDASGVLVVAPAVLTWATIGWKGVRRRELVEGAIVLVVLVVLAELPPQRDVPYIVFPVLLWAALRFGPRGAATAILVVCSITVWNTAQSDGPFVRDSLTDSLLATQLFIATSAITSLLLAAVTAERTRAARALAVTEAAQRALADEQAALRRVATLVAGEAPPSRVFEQVTEEVGRLLEMPGASVMHYDGARTATVVGAWSVHGEPRFPIGATLDLDGDTVVAKVVRSGVAQRVERYEQASGTLAATVRSFGYRAAVAAPVSVGGRLWGVLAAATTSDDALPEGLERRLCDFAELVAQALANADAYEKLAASRARLVEVGDAERRRLERNLHDGAQQRLVSVALELNIASGEARPRPGRRAGGAVRRPGRARPGSCRAARAGPRHPPRRPDRARPWTRAERPARAGTHPGRDRGTARPAADRDGRGGGVLRRRRIDRQRGQVRTRVARHGQHQPLQRTRHRDRLRRRHRRRRPIPRLGPARARGPRGGPQRQPWSRQPGRTRHPHRGGNPDPGAARGVIRRRARASAGHHSAR